MWMRYLFPVDQSMTGAKSPAVSSPGSRSWPVTGAVSCSCRSPQLHQIQQQGGPAPAPMRDRGRRLAVLAVAAADLFAG